VTSSKLRSPEELGILQDEVRKGVGSDTLLRTLGPILETRLESLLIALDQAPADLAILLDLRAKISCLRILKKELAQAVQVGREASQALDR
jgi:hypothetical protein